MLHVRVAADSKKNRDGVGALYMSFLPAMRAQSLHLTYIVVDLCVRSHIALLGLPEIGFILIYPEDFLSVNRRRDDNRAFRQDLAPGREPSECR